MKSKDRVPAGYREGTRDWQDQYDMLLDDGVTCNECIHVERCCLIFGQRPYVNSGKCQFYPNKFKAADAERKQPATLVDRKCPLCEGGHLDWMRQGALKLYRCDKCHCQLSEQEVLDYRAERKGESA